MRKVIVQEWLSLDGFAADKNGNLDFFPAGSPHEAFDTEQLAFLDRIDTILLGRKTYELFVDFWPTATTETELIADRLNELPKIVFSNTLTDATWGKWPPARLARGDAVTEVEQMKAQNGKDMIVWGSLSLAQDLIAANLVDEFLVEICPALAGGGRSMFPSLESYARLKRVDVRTYDNGLVHLHYER